MAAKNDLVLVHIDKKPGFYARIEEISPDVKPGWWQVRLLVLAFPLQVFTWTLDESQINGEPYTMGGTPVRLEKVVSPVVSEEKPGDDAPERETGEKEKREECKVVSLRDRKKKE
ncbi:MAG TPA: hypothetical protein VHN12_03660 [Geobacteraceae bacterium]|nr:hypothetical protein [Geobacteraceae bacterium]